MARVQIYQPGSVQRDGVTGAKFQAADFGTSVMGEGLRRAGAALSDYVEKQDQIEALHDQQDAQRLDLEHVEQTRVLADQLRQARGSGAQAEAKRLEGELTTFNRELLAQARSPRARLALQDSIQRRSIGEIDRYHSYAENEFVQDFRATSDARINALTERARDIEDEARAGEAFAEVNAAIDARARFENWDGGAEGPVAQQARLHQSTQFFIGRAQAIARQGNPQTAIDYATAHADQITGDALDSFVGGLTEEAREQRIENDPRVASIIGASTPTPEPAAPPSAPSGSRRAPVNEGDQPGRFRIAGGFTVGDGYGARRGSGGTHHGVDMFAPVGTPFQIGRDFEVLPGSHRQQNVRDGRDGGNIATIRFADGSEWKAMHLPDLPAAGRYRAGAGVIRSGDSGSATANAPHVHWQPANDQARAIYAQGRQAVAAYLTGNAAAGPAAQQGQPRSTDLETQLAAVRALDLPYRDRQAAERVVRRRFGEVMQAREAREDEAGRSVDQWMVDHADSYTSTSQIPGFNSLSPARRAALADRARANREGDGTRITPELAMEFNYQRLANPQYFASPEFQRRLQERGATQGMLRQWGAEAGTILGQTANQRAQNVTDQRLWSIANPILREIGLDFERVNEPHSRGDQAGREAERQADVHRKNQILTRLREYSQIWTQAHPGQVPDDALMRGWVGNLVLNANGQRIYEADDRAMFVEIMRSRLGAQISAGLARRGDPVTPQNVVAAYRRYIALNPQRRQ